MVKGVTRQVILMDPPDRQRFEKVIFILKDGSAALSREDLLEEARALAASSMRTERGGEAFSHILYAFAGAGLVGAAWVISSFFV